jgi:hypothetical protein
MKGILIPSNRTENSAQFEVFTAVNIVLKKFREI